jgi:hypothetical protein
MTRVSEIHLIGLAVDRPSAAASNNGFLYTATDTAGGTTYRSNGSTWVAIAAGVSVGGGIITAHSGLSGLTSGDDHTQYQKESDLAATVQAYRLDQFAVPNTDLSLNSHKITSLATPTATTDAATKAYVDAAVAGLSWKQAVRVATTTNGTLASAFENGDTVDGVTLATGDRVLLKNQTTGAENGIYTINASGAPTRATDADAGAELVNAAVFVQAGTTNADTAWVCTNNATPTLGSTALTFTQFGAGGGSSLTVAEIDGTPSGTPTTLQFPNGTVSDQGSGVYRYTPAAGGGGPTLLLNFTASTDIINGVGTVAGSWTTLYTSAGFTVLNSGDTIEIGLRGNVYWTGSAEILSRILIDGTDAYYVGGGATSCNLLGGGPIFITGLASGAHTLVFQARGGATGTAYCRVATQPNLEAFGLQVLEWPGP